MRTRPLGHCAPRDNRGERLARGAGGTRWLGRYCAGRPCSLPPSVATLQPSLESSWRSRSCRTTLCTGWSGRCSGGSSDCPPTLVSSRPTSFFRSWGFVHLGAKVAPSHRVQTSLALSAVAIAATAFILGVFAPILARAAEAGLWRAFGYFVLYTGLYVGGIVYAVRQVQREVAEENAYSALVSPSPHSSRG